MSLAVGDIAPAFNLPASRGRSVSLEALRGKPFILYFYPKADTPGCTKEACGFQEALPQLGGLGVEVIGVSKDKLPALDKFSAKYALSFPLASDEDTSVAQAYGVWVEKQQYGRKYFGTERSTFLIDAEGKIAAIWNKVKVAGHVAEVAEAVAKL